MNNLLKNNLLKISFKNTDKTKILQIYYFLNNSLPSLQNKILRICKKKKKNSLINVCFAHKAHLTFFKNTFRKFTNCV
jgi:hypothetical protein